VLDVLTVVQQGTIYWRMLRNGLLASFICLVLLNDTLTVKLLDCHPFNVPLSGTTRVSRYQKAKTSLDFTEARDSELQ